MKPPVPPALPPRFVAASTSDTKTINGVTFNTNSFPYAILKPEDIDRRRNISAVKVDVDEESGGSNAMRRPSVIDEGKMMVNQSDAYLLNIKSFHTSDTWKTRLWNALDTNESLSNIDRCDAIMKIISENAFHDSTMFEMLNQCEVILSIITKTRIAPEIYRELQTFASRLRVNCGLVPNIDELDHSHKDSSPEARTYGLRLRRMIARFKEAQNALYKEEIDSFEHTTSAEFIKLQNMLFHDQYNVLKSHLFIVLTVEKKHYLKKLMQGRFICAVAVSLASAVVGLLSGLLKG